MMQNPIYTILRSFRSIFRCRCLCLSLFQSLTEITVRHVNLNNDAHFVIFVPVRKTWDALGTNFDR